MPKKKTPELTPKEQFKRFQQTAKELGVDDSGKTVDAAFKKLVLGEKSARKTSQRGDS